MVLSMRPEMWMNPIYDWNTDINSPSWCGRVKWIWISGWPLGILRKNLRQWTVWYEKRNSARRPVAGKGRWSWARPCDWRGAQPSPQAPEKQASTRGKGRNVHERKFSSTPGSNTLGLERPLLQGSLQLCPNVLQSVLSTLTKLGHSSPGLALNCITIVITTNRADVSTLRKCTVGEERSATCLRAT